ncbi:MAG: hypothetical protein MZU79_02590 [Anaerotruncus sp.]|nr:hypothetical protein [Anaerotruncus sp.]
MYAKWIIDSTDYAAILVSYIAMRDGWDPMYNLYEIEQTIAMYEMLFQTTDDHITYFYVAAIDDAMRAMSSVEDFSDVQGIWLDLAAKGIDGDMVANAAMAFMMQMVTQQVDNYDPLWHADRIAQLLSDILMAEDIIAQTTADLRDYCAALPDGVDDDCDGLFGYEDPIVPFEPNLHRYA